MAVSLNSVVGFNSKNLQERIKQQQQQLSRCDYVQATAVAIINGNLIVASRRRKVENLCLSSSASSTAAEKDEDDSEESDKGVENTRATARRSPLTARERLRAARVLSKYSEAKSGAAAKSEMGSNVLDAIRESDGGGKRRRSRLPEAPTNMLDDSKRGMPKQGLTFDFPGGVDLFVILVSFVLISSIMFATTYFVWKLGAIHFNDY